LVVGRWSLVVGRWSLVVGRPALLLNRMGAEILFAFLTLVITQLFHECSEYILDARKAFSESYLGG
jgi:hypothetical protein